MSGTYSNEFRQWKELNHRLVPEGPDLMLRRDSRTDEFGILAIDEDGATELLLDPEKALEVFVHPNSSPALQPETQSPTGWDGALDSFNSLTPEEQSIASRKFDRIRRGQVTAPGLMRVAIDSVLELRQVDEAA